MKALAVFLLECYAPHIDLISQDVMHNVLAKLSPTGGATLLRVDPISRLTMEEMLLALRNRGARIFLISLELAAVEAICDQVTIIDRGSIEFRSSTRELHLRIKNEMTKVLYQSSEEIFADVVSDGKKILTSKVLP